MGEFHTDPEHHGMTKIFGDLRFTMDFRSIDNQVLLETDAYLRRKAVRIGDVDFEVTHPCLRCSVTTIDQQTGERSRDGEPLKTLASFRQTPDGVAFGVNLIPRSSGKLRLNDRVTVEP